MSPVYDEIIYPAAGLTYWKTGDFFVNKTHPPLQKLISALPLVAAGVSIPSEIDLKKTDEWRIGYRIIFEDKSLAKKLIFNTRLPTIALTIFLIAAAFLWLFRNFGWGAGMAGAFLLVFDPLLLANGSLALNDVFVTFFFFLAVLLFSKALKGSLWFAAACGLATGAAISSKFSGFLLIPIFIFWEGAGVWRADPKKLWQLTLTLTLVFASAILVILAAYRFNVDVLIENLKVGLAFREGHKNMGFLLVPIPGNATWYYYPIALLIKTPIPLLTLWGFSIFLLLKRKKQLETTKRFLAISALVLLAAMFSPNHFGLRYLLPATPFLALLSGMAYFHLKKKEEKIGWWILSAWLAMEAIAVHPHHMAYFNELIGGSKEGYRWMDGSNQDWGQDLPALAAFLRKEKEPSLIFGYYGSGAPEAYGIRYQDAVSPAITSKFHPEFINPPDTPRELLAVSARLRADNRYIAAYGFLDELKPTAFPGNTIFVYDITKDLRATLELARMYEFLGRKKLFERQLKRALFLDPGNIGVKETLKNLQ